MKNSTLLLLLTLCAAMTACGSSSHQQMLDRSTINAKVDSIVGIKMEEINRQATEDLSMRATIEVKAKADSIVSVRLAKQAQDTAHVAH